MIGALARRAIFLVAVALASVPALAQTLVEWTEAPGRLGLGYPVPIPQDTPLPFDGFRSVAGLHARHQDLMLNSPAIDGQRIGQTALGRDIWLYAFGAESDTTPEGLAKPAVLFNGTIHAREWQSPEVMTGLLELLAEGQDDDHWLNYLRDHTRVLVVPVLNVDGLLTTQRFPRSNIMDTDPRFPAFWPRDGRMRRKNHRDADENLFTVADHLAGVDLNRNSMPFWPGPAINADPSGLTYHGPSPESEPEIQALIAAAELAPVSRLRFYADVHSFGQVLFPVLTFNARRNAIQADLTLMARRHQFGLPARRLYSEQPDPAGEGIGTTSEFFANTFEIPSLTWEIEPTGNGAVVYGGLGSNNHDGFILPEAQIRRVREDLAQTFAAIAYRMSGPPTVRAVRVFDEATGALVQDSRWQLRPGGERELLRRTLASLEPGRAYRLWLGFDRPMRWREAGAVTAFPGQPEDRLPVRLSILTGSDALEHTLSEAAWHDQPGGAPLGYARYRDDAWSARLVIADSDVNRSRVQAATAAGQGTTLSIETGDMTGQWLDANPATVADWRDGAWVGYEDSTGAQGDFGGRDGSYRLDIALALPPPAFPIDPGHSAAWFDPARDGEGFMLEVGADNSALMYWFTYDESGNPRWLVGVGRSDGNRISFPELLIATGGIFGPGFDPERIVRTVVASGEFVFDGCDSGWFDFEGFGQSGRFEVQRLSRPMDIDCNPPPDAVSLPRAGQSGSWFDPARDGEGYGMQWMTDGRALLMWFTYDTEGAPFWLVGVGQPDGAAVVFDSLVSARGGVFGAGFDPSKVERSVWGALRLEIDCRSGRASYQSLDPRFGSGGFDPVRLTRLLGQGCQVGQR